MIPPPPRSTLFPYTTLFRSKRQFLMDWETTTSMPWGVLLLFGGGLSLAAVISSSGLAVWIAESLGIFGTLPTLAMILIITTVILFLKIGRASCRERV